MTCADSRVPLSDLSDETLTALARGGSRDAFAELFRRHERRAYDAAYAVLRDPHDAADAVQDAAIRAFRYIGGLRAGAAFPVWFRKIVVRTALMRCRSRSREPVLPDEEGLDLAHGVRLSLHPSPQEEIERREVAAAVEAALSRLDPRHRQVVRLRYGRDLKLQTIAGILGMPLGTVKRMAFEARQQLREALGDLAREEGFAGDAA